MNRNRPDLFYGSTATYNCQARARSKTPALPGPDAEPRRRRAAAAPKEWTNSTLATVVVPPVQAMYDTNIQEVALLNIFFASTPGAYRESPSYICFDPDRQQKFGHKKCREAVVRAVGCCPPPYPRV